MPVYEYQCGKCEHEFEREQRITDDPVKTCPKCKARRVKLLISQTSFVLKGSGWYSDLYSSKDGSKDKSDDKSESAPSTDAKDSTAPKDAKESKTDTPTKPDDSGAKRKKQSSGKGSKKSGKKAAA